MDKLCIIKIGGNIIDNEEKLAAFLVDFAKLPGKKILVHGGGKLATRLAEKLEVPQQLVEGRRVTDAETLKVVTMVYAGYINKNIVAQLQAADCDALGICGADGNAVLAHKRTGGNVDYGFAGDVDGINAPFLQSMLDRGTSIVAAPITHDGKGQLLNTNADTMAQAIAKGLSQLYKVSLVYCFEKPGVLRDVNDERSVILRLNAEAYGQLRAEGAIFAGMIPKLDNAFAALESGISQIIIGQAEALPQLIEGASGTTIER